MVAWLGPGSPFIPLFDDDTRAGLELPDEARHFYDSWRLPAFTGRPYLYVNFVLSHDGRTSFRLPGAMGGGAISEGNEHDRWLMGLLRARADAVLVGATTLRIEPEHVWTAEAIAPREAAAFAALRRQENRATAPIQIVVSHDGAIDGGAAIFARRDLRVLIVTTATGAEDARNCLGRATTVECLAMGESEVDLGALVRMLGARYGVRSLLCEGGPTLYGSLVAADLVDEEFLTFSPLLIGNRREEPRPGLVEGVAFSPATARHLQLLSVRRAGNFLFLRSRYRAATE